MGTLSEQLRRLAQEKQSDTPVPRQSAQPVEQAPDQPASASQTLRALAEARAHKEELAEKRTIPGEAGAALKSIPRGLTGVASGTLRGLATLGNDPGYIEQSPLYRAGEAIDRTMDHALPIPEEYQGRLPVDVGGGVGSMAGFVMGGAGGGLLGGGASKVVGAGAKGQALATRGGQFGAAASMAGPAGADEAYQRSMQAGLSPEDAKANAVKGIVPGVVQIANINFLLRALPPKVRGRLFEGAKGRLLGDGLSESAVEGAGAVGQNMIEMGYNPETGLFDGAGYQSLVGGLSAVGVQGTRLALRGEGTTTPKADVETGGASASEEEALTSLAEQAAAMPEDQAVEFLQDQLLGMMQAPGATTGGDVTPEQGEMTPPMQGLQITPEQAPAEQPAPQAPTQATDDITEQGTGVFRVPVDQIQVDPQQYQFRSRVNQEGVDQRLAGVERWDDRRAGNVLLHRREDGSLYVADGHHRVDLAKRLGQGEVNANIMDEADGITVRQARIEAAMANVANEKAEALDVAKVFRDTDVPLDQVRSTYNLPSTQVVRDGESLSRLTDNVFGMVAAGQIADKDGAAIGRSFTDEAQQMAAADAFQKIQPGSEYQRELLIQEIRAADFMAAQGEQSGLFGDDDVQISLMQQRLAILDELRKTLNRDKRLFKSLNDNADRANEAGNLIAAEANEAITDQSARSLDLIGRVTTTPELNEMVALATQRLAAGEAKSAVVKDLKKELMTYEQIQAGRTGNPDQRRQPPVRTGQDAGAGERVPERDAGRADGKRKSGVDREPAQTEVAPTLDLETQTEAELAEQARAQQEAADTEARQKREAEQREQADAEADDFVLSGSDSAVDRAEARGQGNMFDAPAEAKPAAPTEKAAETPQQKADALFESTKNAEGVEAALEQAQQDGDDTLHALLKNFRRDTQFRAKANELFTDLADFYTESDNKDLARMAETAVRRRDASDVKETLLARNDGDLTGLQLQNKAGTQGAVFLPDASEPGRFRVTYFDERGFYGHATRDTYEAALNEAWVDGFRQKSDGLLEQWMGKDSFTKGTEVASLIAQVNRGDMTHSEYLKRAKALESDGEQQAEPATRKEAWDLPRSEWVDQEIRASRYADEYLQDATAYDAKADQLNADWFDALMERARTGRISTAVLDDMVARDGIEALNSFRGIHEKGIEGFEPTATRIWDKPYRQVLTMKNRGDLGAFTTNDSLKDFHRNAIRNAISDGQNVPDSVLKDYPELRESSGQKAKATKPESEKQAEPEASTPQEPAQPVAADIDLDQPAHEAFTQMSKAFSGGKALSIEQVKAVFERIVADPAQTKAELNKLTKKDLVRYQAGFPRTDVKKAQMVEFAYDGLISRFRFIGNKSSMISTSLGADTVQIARDHLDTLTNKDVADHAAAQKAAIDERIADLKQRKERLDNPQTIDDFKAVIRSKSIDALTPEQRAAYDRMVAEESMASRDAISGEREGLQTGERVELGEPTEGVHGKTGETIFNVKVVSRLGKDAFKEAAGFARSMGGGYYRGNFYFKSREDAEMFSAWVNGETVDTSAKQEQKKAEKRERTTERMKAIADRLQEQADSKTNADRKENTARRMKMADSARADAEQDSRIASIMKQAAESDSPILKGMTQKVQVELLDSLVRGLKYNAPKDMTYTNNSGNVEFNPEVTPEQRVAYAQIPLKQMYVSTIRDLANEMTNTKGFVMHGRRLSSAIKGEPSNKVIMLDDAMVKNVLRYIDQHADKYSVARDIAAKYKRIERMGITNKPTLRAALLEFMQMDSQPRSAPNKLQQLERDLQRTMVGNRNAFNDFFPTPVETAAEIVDMANINEGMKVLEPSAGNGYLADAAREAGGTVEVVELGGQLREILEEKGHTIVGDDFLEMEVAETYDRIVMNPPFSNDADAKHVAHAYKMLKPGGRLVAITSSMAGNRANKTNQKFRDFLAEIDAEEQALPDGAFKSSMNPTGVSTKIIVIDKPGANAPDAPMFSRTETKASVFQGMSREEFLGNPTITSDRNAADLKPKDLNDGAPREPFMDGQYTATYGENSGAVYDGDKVIASYNRGEALVVDKKYRRRGIGEELVYEWRTRFPAPAKTKERTKKSQALQEKVWERIQQGIRQSKTGYRRTPETRVESLTAEQARAAANNLMKGWKGRPGLTVADSISEFPARLRQAIRDAGAESDMRAVFWNDHVYILAPRIPTEQALQEVVLHEVIGHFGLRKMLGGNLKPLLNQVYMALGNTPQANVLKTIYFQGKFDQSNTEHRLTIAEELIAHLAESNQHMNLWSRIKAAIRDGLRRLGFTLELNDTDLLKLLRGAQRTVEQGGFSRPSDTDINFRRVLLDLTDTTLTRDGDSSRLKNPVTLTNGSRLSGFTDPNTQEVFFGYDRNGEAFTVHRERVNPDDIISSRDSNRTADKIRESLRAMSPEFSRASQTNTEAFKAWFGDSKVVDESGKPLRVYHGTNADFTEFSREARGSNTAWENTNLGFYFIADRALAQEFAEQSGGDTVMNTYLSIQKPLNLTRQELFSNQDQAATIYEAMTGEQLSSTEALEAINDEIGLGEMGDAMTALATDEAKAIMDRDGYDGVISEYGDGALEYVAFNPNQIKSATDNAGTFDPANPDIRFNRQGRPELPELAAIQKALYANNQSVIEGGRIVGSVDDAFNNGVLTPQEKALIVDGKSLFGEIALVLNKSDTREAIQILSGKKWKLSDSESKNASLVANSISGGITLAPTRPFFVTDGNFGFDLSDGQKRELINRGYDAVVAANLSEVMPLMAKAMPKVKANTEARSAVSRKMPAPEAQRETRANANLNRLSGAVSSNKGLADIRPETFNADDVPVQDFIENQDGAGLIQALREAGYSGVIHEGEILAAESRQNVDGNFVLSWGGDPDIRFSRTSEQSEAHQRQVKFMDGFATQPVDRLFRMVFDAAGMVDSHGRLKGGVKLTENAERIIKEWRPSPKGHFAWMDSPLETARHGLLDRHKLTQDYKKAWRQAEAYGRALDMQALDILEKLESRGIDGAEAQVLQKILTGETVPNHELNAVAPEILRAIDDLGQAAVEYGIITREQFERNRGEYLHRSYLRHESQFTGLGKWVHNLQRSRNRKIKGDTAKGRGQIRKVPTAQMMEQVPAGWYGVKKVGDRPDMKLLHEREFIILENPGEIADATDTMEGMEIPTLKVRNKGTVFWPASEPVPAKYEAWRNKGKWKVVGGNAGQVTLWRDWTKAERESMGEILDARYNIAMTFQKLSKDLAMGKFFQDVSLNPEWFSKTEPVDGTVLTAGEARTLSTLSKTDWVQVPATLVSKSAGTKQWGALSGGYVRAEIWRDLNELDKMHNPGTWRAVLTQWKLNKTARSPVVHMNNVMSNLMLMDLADVRVTDLYKGIQSFRAKDEHWRAAQENGAFEGTFINEEIRQRVLQPVLDELMQQNLSADPSLSNTIGTLSKLGYTLVKHLKRADQKMTQFYQLEDELFRMATYMRRLDLGDSPAEAALMAREQFLDYDIRAPWINAARRTVLPFISYTYRAVPVVAQSIVHRPWKLAKYTTLAYLANALAYELAPGDEDEERRTMRQDQQGKTWLGTPRLVRMPWHDQHGNPVFVDVRRWVPAGDVYDMNQGQSALPIPAPIQWGGPIALAFEFVLNKQAFTGQEIVSRDTDTLGEATAKTASWLYKSWMPSAAYIPGSFYWDRVWTAAEGGRDLLGRPYSVPQALVSSVGIKAQPHDVTLGYEFRSRDLAAQARIIQGDVRRAQSDLHRNIISQREYTKVTEGARRKLERLVEQQRTLQGR